jgi:hypothetical protein
MLVYLLPLCVASMKRCTCLAIVNCEIKVGMLSLYRRLERETRTRLPKNPSSGLRRVI